MAKKTPQQYYQERVAKERKQWQFFTKTTNSQILNQVLADHGLELTHWGEVRDKTCSTTLFKRYLEDVVLPDIQKRVGIVGIKVHNKPTHCTHDLFKWIKAEIDPALVASKGANNE